MRAGFDSMWGAKQFSEAVARVDPASGRVLATVNVGSTPVKLQPADGRMWVRTSDAYVAIDPPAKTVTTTLAKADVGPEANRSWAVNGALWIHVTAADCAATSRPTSYKERVADLETDIDDARDRNDPEAAARAQDELDILVAELTAAYGLAGRSRRSPDQLERARKAVSRRLRTALGRVAHAHSRLGRHLDASIRTGTYCSYQPERETIWSVETIPH